MKDPDHWLYRLSADEWLRAAENELAQSYQALNAKSHRPALTYARRAAGMALNALLVQRLDPGYGRSYIDHLKALVADESAPPGPRAAARKLMETPIVPQLVPLGPHLPPDLADAAKQILDYASELVTPAAS